MNQYSKYAGLDTHKERIAVAVADGAGGTPRFYGEIANTPDAVSKLLARLSPQGEVVSYCYEAGPCGYGLYRQITAAGHPCAVVAPSLVPTRAGDRVKTDRRDAENLARLHRAGELTRVWVPDSEQEAMRDLTRAREDRKRMEQHARQRLNAFLLRHGRAFGGKTKWGPAHWRWLEQVRFSHPAQQIVLQEYIDNVQQQQQRVAGLDRELEKVLASWSLAPVVEGLMALRGCALLTAVTILAELGDITRFDTPRQLMKFLGLVPSEHSSGNRVHRGGITKTGNHHVRRVLVESAWTYRFPARKTARIQRRAERTTDKVQDIAWNAQKRLCGRYRELNLRGLPKNKVCVAVAREMCGFLWAIAHEVMASGAVAPSVTAQQ